MLAEDGFLMPSFSKSLISPELLFPQHSQVTHREDNFGSSATRRILDRHNLGRRREWNNCTSVLAEELCVSTDFRAAATI